MKTFEMRPFRQSLPSRRFSIGIWQAGHGRRLVASLAIVCGLAGCSSQQGDELGEIVSEVPHIEGMDQSVLLPELDQQGPAPAENAPEAGENESGEGERVDGDQV